MAENHQNSENFDDLGGCEKAVNLDLLEILPYDGPELSGSGPELL